MASRTRPGAAQLAGAFKGVLTHALRQHTRTPGLGFRKQLAYERHWVGVTIGVLLCFPSLQFNL